MRKEYRKLEELAEELSRVKINVTVAQLKNSQRRAIFGRKYLIQTEEFHDLCFLVRDYGKKKTLSITLKG